MKVWVFLLVLCIAGIVEGKKKHKSITKRAGCGNRGYLCSNGQCIQREWVCDTENDCGNNEDENGCPTDCSGPHQVRCNNNRCIALEYRCDGDNDCFDNTDETGCVSFQCPDGETKCPYTHLCIESAWLCDGDNDCRDNWDEQSHNCPHGR